MRSSSLIALRHACLRVVVFAVLAWTGAIAGIAYVGNRHASDEIRLVGAGSALIAAAATFALATVAETWPRRVALAVAGALLAVCADAPLHSATH